MGNNNPGLSNIDVLLFQVYTINKFNDNINRLTGNNFNIFKVLQLSASETRLHSNLLAELLNPLGSHGQGAIFLQQFVSNISSNSTIFKDFDCNTAKIFTEYYIGNKNEDETEGGLIDILIRDTKEHTVIIENKIYAEDQYNQLLRYHNAFPNATLFYLTLDGHKPSSLGNQSVEIISYKTNIINWLEECKKLATSIPSVRETIAQYISILKYLTNQLERSNMYDEITKFLELHSEYQQALKVCAEMYNNIIANAPNKIINKLREKYAKETYTIFPDLTLNVCINEDKDGVFVGFKVSKNGKDIEATEKNNLYKKLYDIDKRFSNTGGYYVGWFNPVAFEGRKRVSDLDFSEIFSLYTSEDKLNEFQNNIIKEVDQILKKLNP